MSIFSDKPIETIETFSIKGWPLVSFEYLEGDGIVEKLSSRYCDIVINGKPIIFGDGRRFTKESFQKVIDSLNKPKEEVKSKEFEDLELGLLGRFFRFFFPWYKP